MSFLSKNYWFGQAALIFKFKKIRRVFEIKVSATLFTALSEHF